MHSSTAFPLVQIKAILLYFGFSSKCIYYSQGQHTHKGNSGNHLGYRPKGYLKIPLYPLACCCCLPLSDMGEQAGEWQATIHRWASEQGGQVGGWVVSCFHLLPPPAARWASKVCKQGRWWQESKWGSEFWTILNLRRQMGLVVNLKERLLAWGDNYWNYTCWALLNITLTSAHLVWSVVAVSVQSPACWLSGVWVVYYFVGQSSNSKMSDECNISVQLNGGKYGGGMY